MEMSLDFNKLMKLIGFLISVCSASQGFALPSIECKELTEQTLELIEETLAEGGLLSQKTPLATQEDLKGVDFFLRPASPRDPTPAERELIETLNWPEFKAVLESEMSLSDKLGYVLYRRALKEIAKPVELELPFATLSQHITTEDGTVNPLIDRLGYIPKSLLKEYAHLSQAEIKNLNWNQLSVPLQTSVIDALGKMPHSDFWIDRDIPGLIFKPTLMALEGVQIQNGVQWVTMSEMKSGVRMVEVHVDIFGDLKNVRDQAVNIQKELGVTFPFPFHIHVLRYRNPILEIEDPLFYTYQQLLTYVQTEKAIVLRDLVQRRMGLSVVKDRFGVLFSPLSKQDTADSSGPLDFLSTHLSGSQQSGAIDRTTFIPFVHKGYLGYRGPGFYRNPLLEGEELRNVTASTPEEELLEREIALFDAHFPNQKGISKRVISQVLQGLPLPENTTVADLKTSEFKVNRLREVLQESLIFRQYRFSREYNRMVDWDDILKSSLVEAYSQLYIKPSTDTQGLQESRPKPWLKSLLKANSSVDILFHNWGTDVGFLEMTTTLPIQEQKKIGEFILTLQELYLREIIQFAESQNIMDSWSSEQVKKIDDYIVDFLETSRISDLFTERYLKKQSSI
jgi:hypothetical protein